MAAISHINLFCQDMTAQAGFYQRVFGFAEVESYRSPIFRLLAAGGVNLGFNAPDAHALLSVPASTDSEGARFMLNFELGSDGEVCALAQAAVEEGAELVKAPYLTYYQRFQAVLRDPEGNVFRLNFSHPVTASS
jgi:catechol 2,3-dioxygenase-like lactoylglutathione lyase family enzyme